MKDWAEIVAEFEDMAGRVKIVAEQRDDEELRQLARRLSRCAAEIRRDGHVAPEVYACS